MEIVINIPADVTSVFMSVGFLCPQDSFSSRTVLVADTKGCFSPSIFLEKEIEGLSKKDEELIIDEVIVSLGKIGFRQKGSRLHSDIINGFYIIFER